MILCLCPSPAIDITYHLQRLVPGTTNRVQSVARRPGGKAVNVARLLHDLGAPVSVLAPIGGPAGKEFAEQLAALGVPAELLADEADTRTTVTVVDDTGDATVLTEPVPDADWGKLARRAESLMQQADVLVVSGRLPEGPAAQALSGVVRNARQAHTVTVVDTSGPALVDLLRAKPTIVKPNADELAELTQDADIQRSARAIAADYETIVVVSLGAQGVFAASPTGDWWARPARPLQGNPTGAGDALVAGLASGLCGLDPLTRALRSANGFAALLRDAVGLASAAVLHPHAGEADATRLAELRAGVVVEHAEAAR
ncbi:1-phosphofructokinase family hexose kinase [Jatrophihabitans sp. DSM 45814]